MTLEPLLSADLVVQLHVIAALEALALTPVLFLRKRRDRIHKIVGYAWVTNMAAIALTSFWITEIRLIGPFSPIHVLSVLTLVNLVLAIRAIRRRDIRAHRALMGTTAFWALGVAGAFTLLPGRRMHEVFFGVHEGDGSLAGVISVAVLLAAIAAYRWQSSRRGRALAAE